jgi:hypothetical protein
MVDDDRIVTHPSPVWRDRANYILQADLAEHDLGGRFEQLWARDLRDGRFELCCLPFYTYGYALGDVVSVKPSDGPFRFVLGRVEERKDRGLIRIYVPADSGRHEHVHRVLVESGRPHEWHGTQLVAVDIEGAIPDVITTAVERSAAGLMWEWGARSTG